MAQQTDSLWEKVSLPRPTLDDIRQYYILTKPGVLMLVIFSACAGLALAPGSLPLLTATLIIVTITLGSASAAVLNMWYDQDIDRVMTRTQKRPIPSGHVKPHHALIFGLGLGCLAILMMVSLFGLLAGALLLFSIFFYAVIYTMWLKRTTPQNIVVGGAAGAFPPVIAWCAAGGEITASLPWILFAMIFLWTPSHFWALALTRSRDYLAAGVPMLPNTHGTYATKIQILCYTVLMILVSYCFFLCPFNGSLVSNMPSPSLLYYLGVSLLNGIYLYLAIKVLFSARPKINMHLFSYSIFYLFLFFALLIVDARFI